MNENDETAVSMIELAVNASEDFPSWFKYKRVVHTYYIKMFYYALTSF